MTAAKQYMQSPHVRRLKAASEVLARLGLPVMGMSPLEELAVLIFRREFDHLADDQQVYVLAWCLVLAPVVRLAPRIVGRYRPSSDPYLTND